METHQIRYGQPFDTDLTSIRYVALNSTDFLVR